MTITVDLASAINIRTGTGSPTTYSHAGAASGVKGVLVMLCNNGSSTQNVTAVSYGGSALTRVQRNIDTATEPGAADIWFLGTNVPQGTQTVSYTTGATGDDYAVQTVTLLGNRDIWVAGSGGVSENATNPSWTSTTNGSSCMSFAAFFSGLAAPTNITAGTNCSLINAGYDFGNQACQFLRQTTASTSNFTISATAASDDVAFAAVALSDSLQPITLPTDNTTTSETFTKNVSRVMATDNATTSENFSTFLYTPNYLLTLRNTKGTPLTVAEMDANFTNLLDWKIENSRARPSLSGNVTPVISGLSWNSQWYCSISVDTTINAPTGSPKDSQALTLIIKDAGVSKVLTWTTTSGGYRGIYTATLPTATVAGKRMVFGMLWNAQDSRWDVLSYSEDF